MLEIPASALRRDYCRGLVSVPRSEFLC